MALENQRIVKCIHCNNEFEAKFWSVVRGDIDLDLKELILNGEFNLLLCPNCNKFFSYEDNFIYLDPSQEILAFVMPQYYETRMDLVEKLKQDYEMVKEELKENKNLNFEPYYLFGIEELIKLLKLNEDIQEETDVIVEICKIKNLNMKKISKFKAREIDIPFVMPYLNSAHRYDVIDILKEILEEYPRLKRIEKLIKVLEEDEEIDFIDEN